MKKNNLFIFFAFVLFIACVLAVITFTPLFDGWSSPKEEIRKLENEPLLGIFNSSDQLLEEEVDSMEHYVIKWTSASASEPELLSVLPKNKTLLLTIELRTEEDNERYRTVLSDLAEGKYDEKIRQFCTSLAERPQRVYLRLNPEMEVPVRLFPWQYQSPGLYIEAFRHFSNLCRNTAPNVGIVWGTAGYPGLLEWWPGNDVVDMVSVTPGSKSWAQTTAYPQQDSVPQIIRRQIHRLRFVDKPVIILGSELADNGSFRDEWLDSIGADLQAYRVSETKINEDRIFQGDMPAKAEKLKSSEKTGMKDQPLIGLYDPDQQLVDMEAVSVEHLFTDLPELRNGAFRKKFNEVVARNHDVIVTMEPWLGNGKERDPEVLSKTLSGQYDNEIRELYHIISDTERTVYLRWAHEMEIPIERYDWQSQDPIQYIQSYRYFANFLQSRPANIRMVWGPAGDRGSLEWWPGDDVVDYISIAIYGLPDKNITDHEQQESFTQIFKRKFYRMRFVDKPIFITEFGVKGPAEYQKKWLKEAAETVKDYPEVVGISYFNEEDVPEAWGDIEVPKWSISEETLQVFVSTLTDPN